MATLIFSKVSTNRGKPRIWLEGSKLTRENVAVGDLFNFEASSQGLKLVFCADGKYKVSRKKQRGTENYFPVIDLNQKAIFDYFGQGEKIRVAVSRGKIIIKKIQKATGLSSLIEKIKAKKPLALASFYHGGGVMDSATHAGFKKAGIDCYNALTVEREAAYLDSSIRNNQHLFNESSVIVEGEVQQLDFNNSCLNIDGLLAGIPCENHSRAGKAVKKNLSSSKGGFAENGDGGAQIFYLCQAIAKFLPRFCVFECTPDFANSASFAILAQVLNDKGYFFNSGIVAGNDFGALENRKRWVMVAVLNNELPENILDKTALPVKAFAEIMQPLADDDERWKSYDYLAKKEAKDLAAGKGFKRQYVAPDAETMPCITKDYFKVRSTDPQVKHPIKEGFSRLLTVAEHAKAKGVPVEIVANNSQTVAHQILGQGVIYSVFETLAERLGQFFSAPA